MWTDEELRSWMDRHDWAGYLDRWQDADKRRFVVIASVANAYKFWARASFVVSEQGDEVRLYDGSSRPTTTLALGALAQLIYDEAMALTEAVEPLNATIGEVRSLPLQFEHDPTFAFDEPLNTEKVSLADWMTQNPSWTKVLTRIEERRLVTCGPDEGGTWWTAHVFERGAGTAAEPLTGAMLITAKAATQFHARAALARAFESEFSDGILEWMDERSGWEEDLDAWLEAKPTHIVLVECDESERLYEAVLRDELSPTAKAVRRGPVALIARARLARMVLGEAEDA